MDTARTLAHTARDLILELQYRRKVRNHLRYTGSGQIDRAEAKAFWRKNLGVKISLDWHRAYAACNGIAAPHYVPENVFQRLILPALNRLDLRAAYADKNMLQMMFPSARCPEIYLRCIQGEFYDQSLSVSSPKSCPEGRVIVKPSLYGDGGKGVRLLTVDHGKLREGDRSFTWDKLVREYRGNFVVQQVVSQHGSLSVINPDSLNTIRVMTCRTDKIRVVSSVVRFGRRGRSVDNLKTGGVAVGLDGTGKLKGFAVDKHGQTYEAHPDSGVRFKNKLIPGVDTAQNLVTLLHEKLLYFDLASWDLAIDETGEPVLIEVNLGRQGIDLHQFTNGPLFGERTEEVLQRVRVRLRFTG